MNSHLISKIRNNNINQEKYLDKSLSDKLDSEDLILKFRNKYEEVNFMLEKKIRELNEERDYNHNLFYKFQAQIEELQNVNFHFKNLFMAKDQENEENKKLINQLKFELLDKNDSLEKNKEYYINIISDKDRQILNITEELTVLKEKVKQYEHNINDLINQQLIKNKENEDLVKSFHRTKNELENLKEKLYQKYSFMKQRNEILNNDLREKENAINDLLKQIEISNSEKNKIKEIFVSDSQQQKEYYESLLQEKEKKIIDLSNYKSVIADEMKILHHLVSQGKDQQTKIQPSKELNYFDEIKKDYQNINTTADNYFQLSLN